MRIMKFGGSSLADASAIARVKEIVGDAAKGDAVVIVVSAFAGVTDLLLGAASKAVTAYPEAQQLCAQVYRRHLDVISELITAQLRSRLTAEMQVLLHNFEDVLHGVHLVRECSPSTRDLIVSYGERLSASILAYYLSQEGIKSRYVDARKLIVTTGPPGAAVVQQGKSRELIRAELHGGSEVAVVTGFIAADSKGVTTTLGRNGSDYTATLIGAALEVEKIEIWTDVDGFFNADPRQIPGSRTIETMTFEEAQEMAYFGAAVVHPHALQPAADKGIPVVVRNTFNPEHSGTTIVKNNGRDKPVRSVRGMTSLDGVALINLEGSGMIGVPGIAGRLFTALADNSVNIIMITQASSEHSICFVTRSEEADLAQETVEETFAAELSAGLIQQVERLDDLALLSVVGSRMRGTVGLAAKLFGALGGQGINVVAISQGSSERNISIAVQSAEKLAALQAVYNAFWCQEEGSDR